MEFFNINTESIILELIHQMMIKKEYTFEKEEDLQVDFRLSKERYESLLITYYILVEKLNYDDALKKVQEINKLRQIYFEKKENAVKKANQVAKESIKERKNNNLNGENEPMQLLKRIYETDNLEEVINLLDNTTQQVSYLRHQVLSFSFKYENPEEVRQNMYYKFDYYNKVRETRRKELRKEQKVEKNLVSLPKAEEIINEIINLNMNIEEYCEFKGISEYIFNKYLNIVKIYNPELASLYEEKSKEHQEEYLDSQKIKIEKMLSSLKNSENEFTILDYFLQIGEDPVNLSRLSKYFFDSEDCTLIRKYLSKYVNGLKPNNRLKKAILSTSVTIGGKSIGNDVKIQILDFLEKHNVPLNDTTYRLAFNKYLQGQLFVSEETEEENFQRN